MIGVFRTEMWDLTKVPTIWPKGCVNPYPPLAAVDVTGVRSSRSHNIGSKGCVNSPPSARGSQDAESRNPYPQYCGIYSFTLCVFNVPWLILTLLIFLGYKRGTSSHIPTPDIDEVSGSPLYHGIDLAMILPIVALNLRPGEDVLDMNAGASNGTHTMSLAQTMMPRRIVCAEEDKHSMEQVRNQ